MRNKLLLVPLLIGAGALGGCATAPLTSQERSVRILRKTDAPASCREIGKVHSPGFGAWSDQGREDVLKRKTFEAGGDTVTINKTDENNTIFGTAFKCQ